MENHSRQFGAQNQQSSRNALKGENTAWKITYVAYCSVSIIHLL
jgi:hypothetical protein